MARINDDGIATEKLNVNNTFTEDDLCRITNFRINDLPKTSSFVRPFRASFLDERNHNPVERQWDAIDAHVSFRF
jgi:nudix-type nucleoside diphosphatase (YffH/AdpP family)